MVNLIRLKVFKGTGFSSETRPVIKFVLGGQKSRRTWLAPGLIDCLSTGDVAGCCARYHLLTLLPCCYGQLRYLPDN